MRPIALHLPVRGHPFQRSFSVDGAESEEDAHEIMFYSLRKPATVTLKEMYAFGASTKHSTRTLLLAAQVGSELFDKRNSADSMSSVSS